MFQNSATARPFLRATCSVLLLCVLFYFLDWRLAMVFLRQVDIVYVLLPAMLFPVGIWLSAKKWQWLLVPFNVEVGLWRLFQYYWIGAFLSNFLPTSIGGDVSRLAMTKSTGRRAEVAASIIMERITGFAVLLTLSLLSLLLGANYFLHSIYLYPLWFLTLGSSLVLLSALISGDRSVVLLGKLISGRSGVFTNVCEKALKVSRALLLYKGQSMLMTRCLLLSLLFYFLIIVSQYFLFISLGIEIGFCQLFCIAPLITLISLLPISVNSLGLTEGAYVLMLSFVGVPPEKGLAVALLARILQVALSAMGGFFLLFLKKAQ